ncbi:MAG: hypothetical protein ACI9J2_001589 [Saprospiraceae bacterium]|jgi:hypothetical protein
MNVNTRALRLLSVKISDRTCDKVAEPGLFSPELVWQQ